ncbi:MAG: chorismate-binding protein [Weeksellaceae bacterium]
MIITYASFVLFKLPNQTKIQLWELDEEYKGENQFIFNSFDNQTKYLLNAKSNKDFSLEELNNLSLNIQFKPDSSLPHVLSKEEYLNKAEDFIGKLKDETFDKIILSRVKLDNKPENIIQKFKYLCEKYPTAWVYLFHHHQETWLGASPERLLESSSEGLKTVALAATKSKSENREWTAKEYKEHDVVVDYIVKQFKPEAIEKNGPYTIDLGEIQHLKTDIHIKDQSLALEEILANLHPTPAVCGMPKDETKAYILRNEGYNRSFYTGYFGIKTPEITSFYVNLRCAEIFQNHLAIYVGGGLIAASEAESEWNETELKSRALL